MQRRDFLVRASLLAATGFGVAACTTSATTNVTARAGTDGARRTEIDANVEATLRRLRSTVPGSHELIEKANGVLVFPSVIAAGLAVGGEYGEGALRVNHAHASSGYYRIASLSFGLQIGAQSKAVIFLMMTQDALDKFRNSEGWAVGADASVALAKVGANGMVEAANGPVVAFVLTNAGLMANLTLEGTKISRINA